MFVYQSAFNVVDEGTEYAIGWKSKRVYTAKVIPLYTAFLYNIKCCGYKINSIREFYL